MAKEKNLGKLKSRFEVRGGLINEYDFNQNQGAIAEEERNRFARQSEENSLREGEDAPGPQTEADRVEQLMTEAREKAEKNLRKKEKQGGTGASQTKTRAGAGAKKSAGKKGTGGAKKKSAGKGSAGKSGGKKSAAKKSGGRGR